MSGHIKRDGARLFQPLNNDPLQLHGIGYVVCCCQRGCFSEVDLKEAAHRVQNSLALYPAKCRLERAEEEYAVLGFTRSVSQAMDLYQTVLGNGAVLPLVQLSQYY